jgi:hypothetical protein
VIIYVLISDLGDLPNIDQLIEHMWERGHNFSRVGNSISFRNSAPICLSWDKWLDDPRWAGNLKSKEYIYVELSTNKKSVSIELEDYENAVLVDKRAFHNAALYIAEQTKGMISLNGHDWISIIEYQTRIEKYVVLSFEKAVEVSLNLAE